MNHQLVPDELLSSKNYQLINHNIEIDYDVCTTVSVHQFKNINTRELLYPVHEHNHTTVVSLLGSEAQNVPSVIRPT